jgi:hypothetical protein
MIQELILAAGEINSTTITSTPIFTPIKAVFRVVAILVILAGTWKVIKSLIAGDERGAPIRTGLLTLAAAFLLWDISIALAFVDGFGPLVEKVSSSIKQVLTAVGN